MILPKADAVEMDELCVSERRDVWLWTAVSRQTSRILAYGVSERASDRASDNVPHMRAALPDAYERRLSYTDGYAACAQRLPASRHRPCREGDGGTSVVEGVNNSLRHRCSSLVRRRSGPRTLIDSIYLRLDRAVRAHDAACEKRWRRRQAQATAKTT